MTTTHPGPLADDAALHLLADHLLDALASDDLGPSVLHVRTDGDGFGLGVLALDEHPTKALLGFDAPSEWHALGLATHGWAYPVDQRGDPDRDRHRVHVVTLLSRTGEHAHRTRVEGSPAMTERLAGEHPVGEQVDLLRRALGLPTDPPPCGTDVYWTIEWLCAVLAGPGDVPRSWRETVARHPAMALLDHQPRTFAADTADVLTAFHHVCDWSRLRALCSQTRFRAPSLAAAEAAWLDDGAFARFVLNRCPPLAMLRARVDDDLPDPVARRVRRLLDDLAVPLRAWPDAAA